MLELAYLNQDALNTEWIKCIENDFFLYALGFVATPYKLIIEDNDYAALQYVSKNENGDIMGYISANIDQYNNYIERIMVVNFTMKYNLWFSRDFFYFLDLIFLKKSFRKLVFSSVIGNPAVEIFDKLVTQFNLGSKVGILKANRKLKDGHYYDEVIYEIYQKNWIKYRKVFFSKNLSK